MSKFALNRRILIVGEGRETEYNYFVGFREAFKDRLIATATRVSVKRGNGGDARAIVKLAMKEAKKFDPNRKLGDRVFLLLDAEGPGTVPGGGRAPELPAAEKLAADNGIEIIYSCPAIEYWLLCHFANISRAHFADCSAVITALNAHWSTVCKTPYAKADVDVFSRLSHLLDVARVQALEIDLYHLRSTNSERRVNPSTQVYELVAILIGAKSDEKCPRAGTWKLISDGAIAIRCNKGEVLPPHRAEPAHWRL